MPNGIKMAVRRCSQLMIAFTLIKSAEKGWLAGLPGDIAYNCLQSMPFRQELALNFLNEYWRYLQFHSTIDTLKSAHKTAGEHEIVRLSAI